MAGADGSNYGSGFGSGGFGGNGGNAPAEQPRFSINLYSLPWLLLVIFSGLAMLGTWVSSSRWALLATMVFLALAGLTLIIGRAYDPNPQQAAEARAPFDLFARLMIVAAFCIAGGTEVIIIADNLADSPYERMNTIFKFYYQVWTLFAIAGAYFAFVLWTRWIAPRLDNITTTRRYSLSHRAGRFVWVGALWLLCGCVSAYMFMATPARVAERTDDVQPPPTLNGLAFFDNMRSVTGMQAMSPGKVFDFTYEAQSFREFYSKLSGTPVVLQPSIFPYRGGGNWIAINTGLPTVLGWDNHERQQRYPEMVTLRSADAAMNGTIREIYNTSDIKRALDLLRHYHVTYIHMGVIEREGEVWDFGQRGEGGLCRYGRPDYNGQCYEPLMSDAGYNKFDTMVKNGYLEVVYQNPGVSVMKLTAKSYAGVVTEANNGGATPPAGTNLDNSDPRLARLLDTIKRSPSDFQAHYDLGQYYRQRRDFAKAVEQFQITTRLRPKEVNPYHVLGDVYAEMGDFNLALNTYKQATIQAPTVAAAWNKYGMALAQAGQFDDAINNFNQALKVDSKFVEAAYHIGEIYEAQGKNNEARAAYQRTMSDAPEANNFWATRARERLAILK